VTAPAEVLAQLPMTERSGRRAAAVNPRQILGRPGMIAGAGLGLDTLGGR
jgi:hypothetical protein